MAAVFPLKSLDSLHLHVREQVVPVPSAFCATVAAAELLRKGDFHPIVRERGNFHTVSGKD